MSPLVAAEGITCGKKERECVCVCEGEVVWVTNCCNFFISCCFLENGLMLWLPVVVSSCLVHTSDQQYIYCIYLSNNPSKFQMGSRFDGLSICWGFFNWEMKDKYFGFLPYLSEYFILLNHFHLAVDSSCAQNAGGFKEGGPCLSPHPREDLLQLFSFSHSFEILRPSPSLLRRLPEKESCLQRRVGRWATPHLRGGGAGWWWWGPSSPSASPTPSQSPSLSSSKRLRSSLMPRPVRSPGSPPSCWPSCTLEVRLCVFACVRTCACVISRVTKKHHHNRWLFILVVYYQVMTCRSVNPRSNFKVMATNFIKLKCLVHFVQSCSEFFPLHQQLFSSCAFLNHLLFVWHLWIKDFLHFCQNGLHC